MVRIYGRDKKGRFVSKRSAIARRAYRNRVERVKRARALLALFRDAVDGGIGVGGLSKR